MISYEKYCEIQACKSIGLSQRKTAEKLSLNRMTVSRYWDMSEMDFEASESIKNKLYLKRNEICTLATSHSPEEISEIFDKKYKLKTSARSIRRLLNEYEHEYCRTRPKVSLYCGDCKNVLPHIEDESVDLVIVDMPYKIVSGGTTKEHREGEVSGIFNKRIPNEKTDSKASECNLVRQGKIFEHNDITFPEWIPEIYRILKEGTHFYCMTNGRNMKDIWDAAEESGFRYVNTLVWDKGNATPNRYYMQACEFILLFRKGEARSINHMGSKNIIDVPNPTGKKEHPTEKPSELMRVFIENSSNIGDTVLDCFMGVGGTGVACVETGRNFIGIEIDKEYFKIATDRINKNHRK